MPSQGTRVPRPVNTTLTSKRVSHLVIRGITGSVISAAAVVTQISIMQAKLYRYIYVYTHSDEECMYVYV